jgi:TonB family protein
MRFLTLLYTLILVNVTISYSQKQNTNDSIYEKVDVLPEFNGGEEMLKKYVIEQMRFEPNSSDKKIINVQLSFVVKKDGSIGEVTILSEKNDFYDEEAIRLIKNMPKWVPAKIGNENVNSILRKNILFDLKTKKNHIGRLIYNYNGYLNKLFKKDLFYTNLSTTPFLTKNEIKEFQLHIDSLIFYVNETAQLFPEARYDYIQIEDYRGVLIAFNYYINKLHKQKNKNISSAFSSLTTQLVTTILKNTTDNTTIITNNNNDFWAFWYINETEKINPTVKIISPNLYKKSNNRTYFKKVMKFESILDTNFISQYKTSSFSNLSQSKCNLSFNQFIDSLSNMNYNNSWNLDSLTINYLGVALIIKPYSNDININDLIILDIINQSKSTVILAKKPKILDQYYSIFLHYYKLQNKPYRTTNFSPINEPFIRDFLLKLDIPQSKLIYTEITSINWIKGLFVLYLIQNKDETIFEKFLTIFPLNENDEMIKLPYTMTKVFFDYNRPDLAFNFLNAIKVNFKNKEIRDILCSTPQQHKSEVVRILIEKNVDLSSIAYIYEEDNKKGLMKNNQRLSDPIYEQILYDSLPLNQFKLFQTNLVGIATEKGEIIIPAIYDSISFTKDNIYIAKKKSEMTLYNAFGDKIISNDSVKIDLLNNYYASFITYKNNQCLVYNYNFSKNALYQIDNTFDSIIVNKKDFVKSKFYKEGKETKFMYYSERMIKNFNSKNTEFKPNNNKINNFPDLDHDGIIYTIFEENNSLKEIDENEIFEFVEISPEFPGGKDALYKFIGENISYPKECLDNKIEGKVYVKFAVMKDGSIKDIKVLKGAHKLLDQEAIRVIQSMPKWTPGKQRGKDVNVYYTLPVNFTIN